MPFVDATPPWGIKRQTGQRDRTSDPWAELLDVPVEALRGVQEAARRMSRSLGEPDVAAELGRQAARLTGADVVSVLRVSVERLEADTMWRCLRDQEVPRRPVALAPGLLLEAARSGRRMAVRGALDAAGIALDDLDSEGLGLGTALAVPMIAFQRLEGVLLAAWRGEAPPLAEDTLEALAAHGTLALRNARLYAESEAERRQSEALGAAAAAVGGSLRVGDVQRLILRHAQALLRAEGAALALVEDRYANIVAAVGSAGVLTGRLVPLDASLEGEVVRSRAPAVINDVLAEGGVHRPTARAADVRRVLAVPLVTGHGVLGVLSAMDREVPFGDDDVRCLQRLADQCALAIWNARLFEQVQSATQEWKLVFDAVPVGVVVLDEQGTITRFNARALALADAGAGAGRTLLGRGLGAALHGTADAPAPAPVAEALASGAEARGLVAVRDVVFDVRASPHPAGGVVATFDVAIALSAPGTA